MEDTMKEYRFEIKENPFHGGKHIAYSNSIRNAIKILGCCNKSDCQCGGTVIVDLTGKLDSTDIAWEIHKLRA
jgi:hypothetical protein